MDVEPQIRKFYLDSINEEFAEIFFLFGGGFNVRMQIVSETSLASAFFSRRILAVNQEKAIDFELCAFECSGVAATYLEEYFGITVHTSSVLEFFDYVFSQKSKIAWGVDFPANSWTIVVEG